MHKKIELIKIKVQLTNIDNFFFFNKTTISDLNPKHDKKLKDL